MNNEKRTRTSPMQDEFSEPFWQTGKEGRLVVQRATSTGRLQWPPRPKMLPNWNETPEWTEVAPTGTVYSYSVIHRSSHKVPAVPYVLAVVELDAGVMVTTNIVDVDPEKVHIGMKVKAKFEKLDEDISLAVFAPAQNP